MRRCVPSVATAAQHRTSCTVAGCARDLTPCVFQCRRESSLRSAAMALVTERVHPRGLNFNNQRLVVILREQGMEYPDIATRVKNLEGNHPDARMCCNVYQKFNVTAGRVQSNYH